MFLAKAINTLKFFFIVCIILSQNPFQWFAASTPNIYTWALQNKVYASMMLFFLAGLVEGQLTSTGAFEIYFNDMPIWSKLESDRIPSLGELMEILNSHLRLSSNLRMSPI